MLAKLLKYEVKATARFFLPLYVALIAFSLINRLLNPFEAVASPGSPNIDLNLQVIISIISMMAYFALMVGTLVMTVIVMIQRFYKNLLGDEGYLMFTLPVKTWQHITSKLLVAMLWAVLSFLITAVSILITANVQHLGDKLRELVDLVRTYLGPAGPFIIPAYIFLIIAFYTVMVYAAIALGHLFDRHRLAASFGMICVLYFVYQIISAAFIFLLSTTIPDFFTASRMPTPHELNTLLAGPAIISIVLTAVNFTLTNIILQTRLNLE